MSAAQILLLPTRKCHFCRTGDIRSRLILFLGAPAPNRQSTYPGHPVSNNICRFLGSVSCTTWESTDKTLRASYLVRCLQYKNECRCNLGDHEGTIMRQENDSGILQAALIG